MKKKKLKKIIKSLKMENARLIEMNKQGLSDDLEQSFNDLLHTGKSVSGPFVTDIAPEIDCVDAMIKAEMFTPNPQKGIFDNPKYRSPFFSFGYGVSRSIECEHDYDIDREKAYLSDPIKHKGICRKCGNIQFFTYPESIGISNINGNPV